MFCSSPIPMAGMVATGAADREPARVARLLYLDAFVPDDGESLWSLVGPAREAEQRAMAQAHDGGRSVPRALAPASSAPDNAERFGALFRAQPVGCLSEPFRRARTLKPQRRIPRDYVLCAGYRPSPFQAIAARMRARGAPVQEIDALHDVVRTDAALIAEIIDASARRVL